MKTKNDLKTGILIGIGMIVIPLIIMSSKPITTTHTIPESHVWEMFDSGEVSFVYMYNKITGEVRKLDSYTPTIFNDKKFKNNIGYVKMVELFDSE